MKKREIILISVLTVLIAFMDISGIPSVLFVDRTHCVFIFEVSLSKVGVGA